MLITISASLNKSRFYIHHKGVFYEKLAKSPWHYEAKKKKWALNVNLSFFATIGEEPYLDSLVSLSINGAGSIKKIKARIVRNGTERKRKTKRMRIHV